MFIDYVSLLLINAMAGYFLLAYYVYLGLDDPNQTKWAPGFLMVGVISAVFGGIMAVTWPLPGPYSSAYSEMSVLLGIVFLGAGVAMAKGWDLTTVACYAFFAGLAAIVVGVRIIHLRLTLNPTLSGAGFILSGIVGVCAAPTLAYMKSNRGFRTLGAIVVVAAALIWAATVYPEYWTHMKMFGKWVPLIMRSAPPQP
jgi:putative membrane protein